MQFGTVNSNAYPSGQLSRTGAIVESQILPIGIDLVDASRVLSLALIISLLLISLLIG